MSYNKETKMYEGFIYKIWNDVNNKIYIGQTTTTIEHRFSQHLCDARKGRESLLYNAILKYGEDKFHIGVIFSIALDNKKDLRRVLNEKEKYYISLFNSTKFGNGYNLTTGGDNYSQEKKIQVDQYDKNGTFIQTYESMAEAVRIVRGTDSLNGVFEISDVCNGKQHTAFGFVWRYHGDSFDKYDLSHRIISPNGFKRNPKPVCVFTRDNDLIGIYKTAVEGMNDLGLKKTQESGVYLCLNYERKTAGGYVWRYLSEIQSKGDDIMKSFIKTSDEQTADLLRKAGLYELAKEGDKFVFVNDMKKTFSLEDGKMFYTNKLCF